MTACGVAVILIAVAIVKYFEQSSEDSELTTQVEECTVRLKEMYELPIFPSAENMRAIETDEKNLNNYIQQCKKYFRPIPPLQINNVQGLRNSLDTNIYNFYQEAKARGVTIMTNNYAFSFDELMKRINFSPFSVRPLAQQLAEVDEILKILFAAKINRLEFIQRARACVEDMQPNVSSAHYIANGPITNAVMIAHPYKIIFSCFSGELTSVMEGFMRSPYGFVIKAIDVEPSGGFMMPPPGGAPPPGGFPGFTPGMPPIRPGFQRFPGGVRQPRQPGGNVPRRGFNPNQPPSYAAPPPLVGSSAIRTNRAGVITLFNERPFRVSMLVYVVNFK